MINCIKCLRQVYKYTYYMFTVIMEASDFVSKLNQCLRSLV